MVCICIFFEGEREGEQIEILRSWLTCLCGAGKLKILKAGQLAANSGRISGFQTSDRFSPFPVQQGSAGISTSCSRGHLLVHVLAKQTARLGECLTPFLVIQGCWCGSQRKYGRVPWRTSKPGRVDRDICLMFPACITRISGAVSREPYSWVVTSLRRGPW